MLTKSEPFHLSPQHRKVFEERYLNRDSQMYIQQKEKKFRHRNCTSAEAEQSSVMNIPH